MPSPGSILRQLSGKEGYKSTSKRWVANNFNYNYNGNFNYEYNSNYGASEMGGHGGGQGGSSWGQMQGFSEMYGYSSENHNGFNGGQMVVKKRVMVMVGHSSRSKHAMMWALTHVANEGDMLTLLHIIPAARSGSSDTSSSSSSGKGGDLASSLGSLCKACKPEVEVEALVIQGPKLATVLSQVKKLEVSVLVLGQKKPSPLMYCLFGMSSSEDFVDQCINNAECLTIGVRKQSQGMGGYLVSTRFQKNFWLLA